MCVCAVAIVFYCGSCNVAASLFPKDLSGFETFTAERFIVFPGCDGNGALERSTITRWDDGSYFAEVYVLGEHGEPGDPSIVRANRELTSEETDRLLALLQGLVIKRSTDIECFNGAFREPCSIVYFDWDDFRANDFHGDHRHLAGDRAVEIIGFLEQL